MSWPTQTAVDQLRLEGMTEGVRLVGDVMYDEALHYREKACRAHRLDRFEVTPRRYVLATVHRAENTDGRARLAGIFQALNSIAESTPVLLPLHPRTKRQLAEQRDIRLAASLRVIDPVSYLEMTLVEAQ